MSKIVIENFPFGGSKSKEKEMYEIRVDNEADWPAAPITGGEGQLSVIKDPEHGGVYIKFMHTGVRDKHGEVPAYLKVWGSDVHMKTNFKHFSPTSLEQLSKTPAPVPLKPKRVLSDEEKATRAEKARKTREANKAKKKEEEAKAPVTLGD